MVSNIKNYLETQAFFYQKPQNYDVLKVDPYITNTAVPLAETIIYESKHEKSFIDIDPLVNY